MICVHCKVEKSAEDFREGRTSCKACESEKSTSRRHKRPIHEAIRNAKRRARDKGLDFDLCVSTIESIIRRQEHKCFYTRTHLHVECGGARATQISLDRVDNDRGYTPGNIVVAALAANRARNDATVDQFMEFMHSVRVPTRSESASLLMARLSSPTGVLISGFSSSVSQLRKQIEALGVKPTEIVHACSGMALFACFAHEKERAKILALAAETTLIQVLTTQGEISA